MTRKEQIKEIFNNHGIFITLDEVENLGDAIRDTLELIADETEKNELYATGMIDMFREVAGNVQTKLQSE
jgi:hypothetical protein